MCFSTTVTDAFFQGRRTHQSCSSDNTLDAINDLISLVFLCLFSRLAAAVPKNSPYKKFMERKLLQLQESGTITFIAKRWEEGTPVCEEELNKDSLALGPGITQCCLCLV